MSYIFDIGIVLLLAFFAWRGAARGLILSLCGLATVFVAFFAAQFISDAFCTPVANIIRPVIAQSISELVPPPQDILEELDPDATEEAVSGISMDELMSAIRDNELFEGFSAFLEEGAAKIAAEAAEWTSPVNALAGYLSRGIAKALLFGIVFVGIQLIWFLLSHTLDLAFKLPILSQVNLACGLVFGLAKGVLLIVVLVWLGQLTGLVPADPSTPVLSLFTVKRLGELLSGLPS